MQLKTLLCLTALSVFSASTAFAAKPSVNWNRYAVTVTCPVIMNTEPPVLIVNHLSARNHKPFETAEITQSGVTGVKVSDRTFTFPLDLSGENHVLGHLPGLFSITCHRPDHRNNDTTFVGEIK